MESNFSFLETDFPVLYKYGCYAEQYLYNDPNSCLFKMGQMGEAIINLMFDFDNIELPYPNDAKRRINKLRREDLLDEDMTLLFHDLRKMRNGAVHEGVEDLEECKRYLPIIHSLAAWFQEVYGSSMDFEAKKAVFIMPSEVLQDKAERTTEDSLEQQLLAEATQKAKNIKKVALSVRQKTAAKVASCRRKTEAETRLLIDKQLCQVGWEADTEVLRYSKGTRPQRGRNIAIAEWPTDSSVGNNGFADYALFVGLKLVAIIEAKAMHKSVSSVIDYQCKEYSRSIKERDREYLLGTWGEYKVPFIFATNGRPYIKQLETESGIWFLDLREGNNAPRALRGWMSPTGLMELLKKDIATGNKNLTEMPYNVLRDKDGLNLRDYQIKGIQATEEAVLRGQQNILIAMATGTGKTRTILGLIYLFLKTGRFRNILYLVDRNALGKQAMDVFKEVKLEELMTLDDIYNIKGLEDKTIDRETRIHVATVQSMVKRILYNEEDTMPSVSDYDLVIIDEAHRGYILDKEMGEAELLYRSQLDYQSKYRNIVEYFDAVRIAMTATPALHTTEIFGQPVFSYSYREAVIEGYLVDHDAPHELKTKLGEEGIHYKSGEKVTVYVPGSESPIESILEDELDFDIDNFNRQVITEEFNRAVLAEIANDIDPESPDIQGKTLIYAVDDQHADLIVKILKEIYSDKGVDNDAIMKITGSVAGGNQKKIEEVIRRFKNERYPSMVVTVDLLTTGIDVPEITTLVFMRRVKSRILFEQMLGRATRLCPSIKKTHFEIYDPVGVYSSLEQVSDMKPVSASPTTTIEQLLEGLDVMDNEEDIQNQIDQILAKVQRKAKMMDKAESEQLQNMTEGKNIQQLLDDIRKLDPASAKEYIKKREGALRYIQGIKSKVFHPVVVSDREDELIYHGRGYGKGDINRPEDYLEAFSTYIKNNMNVIAALNIICTKPRDLTREGLKKLRITLDMEGYTEQKLNTAISQMTNQSMTADIISLIRRYALGSALVSHEERIKRAMDKIRKAHSFSKQELNWLLRIEKYLINESVVNISVFDEDDRFKSGGGFAKINKVFQNKLENIIQELNEYLYEDGGHIA